jgi:hypothetical protein
MPGTRRRTRSRHRTALDGAVDCSTVHPDVDAHLGALALQVEDAYGDDVGWDGPNQVLRVTCPLDVPRAVDVARAPVDGDLGAALAGFRAPDDWDAIGVATLGWWRPMDERGRPGERGGRVRSVHIQHRVGPTASVLHRRDGAAELVPGPVEGRVADLLRRAVGLRTAPPANGPVELFALHWLSALLAAEPGSLGTWEHVAAHHPLLAVHDDARWPIDALDRFGEQVAAVRTWEQTRRECARGELEIAGVDPALASWFDEGSFARWVLDGHPPVGVLADAAGTAMPASVGRKLRSVLRAWGLDVAGPPR